MDVYIKLHESGADGARLESLASGLCLTINSSDSLSALRTKEGSSSALAKPVDGGFVLGGITVSVALARGVRDLTQLLRSWIDRDSHRHLTIVNPNTGEEFVADGIPADQCETLLKQWYEAKSKASE